MKTISLLSVLFFFLNLSVFAQDRELPPISLEKISDNLYQILGGKGANGGVYIGGKRSPGNRFKNGRKMGNTNH